MISIKPEHAINILNGSKTLELRTWIPKDYVGWVYVYVTKGKPYLVKFYNDYPIQAINDYTYQELLDDGNVPMNGKVAFRFWFDDYIAYKYYEDDNTYFAKRPQDFGYNADEVLKRLCLSRDEFKAYGKGKDLYAWHIKKLEIFDTPKQLSEFQNYVGKVDDTPEWAITSSWQIFHRPLEKGPQKMQWVYVKELENE